jgi:hypothetical protein
LARWDGFLRVSSSSCDLPLNALSLILESCSLTYYVIFLVFPFQTETDEEDKARDIIEALDCEGSPAPSIETRTSIRHEKMTDEIIVPVGEDEKSQIPHLSLV